MYNYEFKVTTNPFSRRLNKQVRLYLYVYDLKYTTETSGGWWTKSTTFKVTANSKPVLEHLENYIKTLDGYHE